MIRTEIELRSRGLNYKKIAKSYLDLCVSENNDAVKPKRGRPKRNKLEMVNISRIDKNYQG